MKVKNPILIAGLWWMALVVVLATVLALTACGGGGSETEEPVALQCVARHADPVIAAQMERECMERAR